jgi:putative inorganic carbon (HCO3(-)) transporter
VRDAALLAVFMIALPLMLWRPTWGALSWVWFGIFNPNRYAWGFAATLPFAAAIFVATFIGAFFSKEPKRMKGGVAAAVLLAFLSYTVFTTFVALVPDRAWDGLGTVMKIQFGTLLVLVLLYRKDHVLSLVWVIAASVGFYAIKGGVFTILTFGEHRVWGPAGTYIADNNAFALATVISIPLWAYLYTQYRHRVVFKWGILSAIALSAVSVLGSHSRGAVLAIIAMAVFLWLKSRMKLALGMLMVLAAVAGVSFMPESWEQRMATITDPQSEGSANSRLETWKMLLNLANDRPLTGGGFNTYAPWVYEKYNPASDQAYAAHSIYFQVLGEHGWLAFALFLLFWALVWRMCSQVVRMSRDDPEQRWAYWLAQMLKVSMVAFLVGGAFLNLAYWDVPYYLFVAIAVARSVLLENEKATAERAEIDQPGDHSAIPVLLDPAAEAVPFSHVVRASGHAERT